MNNILFIGGAGFIGSSLVKRFLKGEDYHIVVLEPERASKARLKPYKDQIILEEGDLRDSAFVLQVLEKHQIQIVVHLVSTMIPGSTLPHFQNEMDDILMPTMNIMELCAERHVKFVYFSSGGTVYGNSKMIHHEADPCEPISYYGLSKLMVEKMIAFEHRRSGMDYLIVRPSNPYGPGQNIHGRQGLIAVALGKVMDQEPLTVWGDGGAIRDYIYIDDLADAIYQLINKGVSNDIYNIGSGVGYSITEVVAMINELTHDQLKVEHVPGRKVDVDKMVLDIQKLRNTIDLHLLDIHEGLCRFIDYLKK